MKRHRPFQAAVAAFISLSSVAAAAQQQPTPPAAGRGAQIEAAKPDIAPDREVGRTTPLRFTVTISRYQGDRRISSVPYTLSLNARGEAQRGQASLRLGTRVPVTQTFTSGDGKTSTSYTYEELPTNIDLFVFDASGGGYRVDLTLTEKSLIADDKGTQATPPSFRTLTVTESTVIRDGQTLLLSTTPDKTTGEVVRVELGLTVLK